MKIIIILLIFFIVCVMFPTFACAVFNPHFTVGYGSLDLFHYFKYRSWRNAYCGELVCFTGLFGKGKTLSAVHKVVGFFKHYNGLMVYDRSRKQFVLQQVVVLSNVELTGIPYLKFQSLQQIVELSKKYKIEDEQNGTLTYMVVLGDEFSVQLNSRNFKTNIDPLFLNTLLTCRHYHISIYYTAQRFSIVDALLRQVTQTVIDCDKLWRFQRHKIYDAYQLENCTNPLLVEPLRKACWFVRNRDYKAYDTLACVGDLEHSVLSGDMLSAQEILNNIQPSQADTVVKYSKKAKKRRAFKK